MIPHIKQNGRNECTRLLVIASITKNNGREMATSLRGVPGSVKNSIA